MVIRRMRRKGTREGDGISGVFLQADSNYAKSIYKSLDERPQVAGTVVKSNAIQNFHDTLAESILIFTFVNTLLAATVAFGVVYNSARVALSERGRELASLRVLGFTRGEIYYILIGELSTLTLLAIPVGFVVGRWLCAALVANLQTDLYRIPLVLEPPTYSFAATVILCAAALCAVYLKIRLDRLDLLEALKTRE